MTTTIQIDEEIRDRLASMKLSDRESYNDVLERLLEDLEELDTATVKRLKAAEKEFREGKVKTHKQVKEELGFD